MQLTTHAGWQTARRFVQANGMGSIAVAPSNVRAATLAAFRACSPSSPTPSKPLASSADDSSKSDAHFFSIVVTVHDVDDAVYLRRLSVSLEADRVYVEGDKRCHPSITAALIAVGILHSHNTKHSERIPCTSERCMTSPPLALSPDELQAHRASHAQVDATRRLYPSWRAPR